MRWHALWGLFLLYCVNFVGTNKPLDQNIPNRISLPFSVDNGVPYLRWKEIGQEVVGSMVVDENHDIFIIGGKPAVLVKYSYQGKELYRRKYGEFPSGQLYALGGKLYIFDRTEAKNNLYIINADNGQIDRIIAGLSRDYANSYCFADGKLTLQLYDSGMKRDIDAKLHFMLYDLDGRNIGPTTQACNIPEHLRNTKYPPELTK